MARNWAVGRISIFVRCVSIALLLVLGIGGRAAEAAPRMDHLTLVVPAGVGGGWDLTAKSMKRALESKQIVRSVEIVRFPGVGGLVGLSQFLSLYRGRDDALLMGGLTMLGATISDEAAVSLRDVTPIARLTGDWGLIAVRADSPIHSVADLRKAMLERSNGLRWSGGALGSPDQALVWSLASRVGVPADDVLYYGKVGGRRAADALLEGRVDVAVSGYAEFRDFISRGQFRPIAVSSPGRIAGLDVPTLRDEGIDVSIMNWRGVFAAPGLSLAQQEALGGVMAAMRETPEWRQSLNDARWTDAYLDQGAFTRFIERETARWPSMINPQARNSHPMLVPAGVMFSRNIQIILALAFGLVCAVVGRLVSELVRKRKSARVLESRCAALQERLSSMQGRAVEQVKWGIQEDFGQWALSDAERDIAWFMLRGLPLREIADLRGTSERTVRQQAQSIYRKAGLEGRSDLAGRVLERFI